jgi:hypothetical protein
MPAHCTIIIPCLDSHEVVRRQVLHFDNLLAGMNIQVLLIDDGSDPPLPVYDYPWLRQHATGDKRHWTQGIAANTGATMSDTPYIMFMDIDHAVTRDVVMYLSRFDSDAALFQRRIGTLADDGTIITGKTIHPHVNTYVIRRELFAISPRYHNKPGYVTDREMRSWLHHQAKSRKIKLHTGPAIVSIDGKFHDLKRS